MAVETADGITDNTTDVENGQSAEDLNDNNVQRLGRKRALSFFCAVSSPCIVILLALILMTIESDDPSKVIWYYLGFVAGCIALTCILLPCKYFGSRRAMEIYLSRFGRFGRLSRPSRNDDSGETSQQSTEEHVDIENDPPPAYNECVAFQNPAFEEEQDHISDVTSPPTYDEFMSQRQRTWKN